MVYRDCITCWRFTIQVWNPILQNSHKESAVTRNPVPFLPVFNVTQQTIQCTARRILTTARHTPSRHKDYRPSWLLRVICQWCRMKSSFCSLQPPTWDLVCAHAHWPRHFRKTREAFGVVVEVGSTTAGFISTMREKWEGADGEGKGGGGGEGLVCT